MIEFRFGNILFERALYLILVYALLLHFICIWLMGAVSLRVHARLKEAGGRLCPSAGQAADPVQASAGSVHVRPQCLFRKPQLPSQVVLAIGWVP